MISYLSRCISLGLPTFAFVMMGNVTLASPGNWQKGDWTSEMNDFRNLSFSVDSQEMVPNQFGFGGQYAKLTISCIENRTNIYVNWRRYITTGGIYNNHSVRYRIDKNSPRTEKWSMSTDYEATGKWRGSGISLIKRLKGASSFLLETTPYGDNTVRARFDIKGINQVVEQIANRCGWKP